MLSTVIVHCKQVVLHRDDHLCSVRHQTIMLISEDLVSWTNSLTFHYWADYSAKAIGYDYCSIVRLSSDAIVRWHYCPNPSNNRSKVWWDLYYWLCYKFTPESHDDRKLNISQHLAKLLVKVQCCVCGFTAANHPVLCQHCAHDLLTCTLAKAQ